MASQSSAADQSIDENAEEKKVGDVSKCVDGEDIIFQPKEAAGKEEADNSKEEGLTGASIASVSEEKHELDDVSVSDVTKKEEQHETIREVDNSIQESEVSNSSEPAVEINERNLQSQADDAHETPSEVQENSSDFVETSASHESVISESKTEDLKDNGINLTFENDRKLEGAPLVSTGVDISEDGNAEAETQEEANSESSKDKVNIELIKSEDPKDEIQVLVPTEIPTAVVPDTSEVSEKKDTDSGNPTSVEVAVKDLEVESGFLEEHKSKETAETKEPSSNVSTIDAVGEVVGSSSYEGKPAEVAEVVEKKADGLEVETIQTTVKNQDDIEAKPELAQAQFDENVSKGVEVKKDDEIFEGGIETSAVPDGVLSLAEVSSEEEKASEPGIVVEEKEGETYLKGENIDILPKVAGVTLEGGNVLEGDKLVDKEKVVNAEAIESDLVDTFTDPTETEVSSDEVKAPTTTEIVKEALEVTSKELNITPEASEVSTDGDKLSAGDGKSESLKGEAATSVEAPKDITTAEESLDQVIEEKSESSISETQVLSEDNLVNKEKYVNEEAKEINGADETPSAVQSDFTETSISQEPVFLESKNEDLKDTAIKPTSENDKKSEEAPLVSTNVDISEDGNVVAETQEAANPEFSNDKVDIKLVKSEDSKDEIQLLVPDKISTVVVPDASETPEINDFDLSDLTSIEVPVEDLEVESGSPEEQKSKEGTETKEPSLNMSTIDAGGEVARSFSYEIKPSGVAEVVEKKDDCLEVETIETSVKIQEDLEAKAELAQTESDENVSQGVEVKKDDEIVQGGIETSTVPDDVPPFAKVSSEKEKASEPGVVVEEEDNFLESDNIDTVPKVAQVSLEGGNVFEGDRLVDKEKVVNTVAADRDLVDTFTDPTKVEVSFDQVKAPPTTEIVNEASEVTSKKLNITPEANEVPAEVDKVYVNDEEKSEILKGGDATSLEVPKYIISGKELLDQSVEEKKCVSSVSEMAVPDEDKFVDKGKYVNIEDEERDLVNTSADHTVVEVSSEQLKVPEIVDKHSLEEVSKVLNITPEASEVPAKSDKLSAGEEKSESFEGEAATLVEALKDITTTQESLDQVIEEKKNESSTRETHAPSADKFVEKEKYVNEEAKEIYLQSQADGAPETPSVVQSDFVETSAFQEPLFSESKTEDLKDIEIKPTSENEGKQGEAPLVSTSMDISEDRNVEAVTREAENPEFSKDKLNMELIKSEDSKDDIQVFVPAESPTVVFPDTSEAPEKNDVDSSYLTSIEVPAKDTEVESGYPEEQKPIESTETNETGSNVSTPDTGGEVVGSSYEAKPSGNAVVEKKDDGLEVETLVEIHENLKAKPELAQTQSDENISEGAEVKKDDEIVEGGIVTSTVPDDVPPLSTASSEEEKTSEPGVVGEEDETSLKGNNIGIVAEVSLEGRDVLEGNELVDKEKVVNAEAVERDLVGTFIDPADAEVYSDQVKTYATTEIVKEESDNEALEMTSKELNIAPEASEVPYEVDTISAGDEEKSERLIVRDATSVEAPKDIITVQESLDQLVEEKKGESLISEMAAPTEDRLVDKEKYVNVEDDEKYLFNSSTDATVAEVSSEHVKSPEIDEEESTKPGLEETFKELNITSEASEVPSEDDKFSAGEEKDESLKGEAATSVEVPKDITIVEESLDQVIEEKMSENSVSEMEALIEDKLVDKEKNVNEEAKERDLVDTSTDPTPAEVSSDQVKASETAEIIKEESNKQPLEVPSEGDEVSPGDEEKRESLKGEDATLLEAPKDITIAEESSDQVIKQKKSEASKSEMEALAEDKLVDKEKDVNAEVEKTNLVDIPTDPSADEVFSEQIKVTKTAEDVNESDKEILELTSKELNIVPVAVEVLSEGDKVSSGEEEKSVSLKGEDATSLEAPKDINAVEKSIDLLIEENKGESSKNETQAPIETTRDFDTSKLFPEAVKEIISSEAVVEKQNETSNDLSVEEKKADNSEDKKEEVRTEGVLQNATDKPEQEELGAEKAESERSKDQDPIVSSYSRDVKLTKEEAKRESNIFSKMKRSIVKAKKAILRKSPGPKTLSSEAKDENA